MAEGGQDRNFGVAEVIPTSLSSGTSRSAILAEGDNVNLKFAKSTVNVVTGDQINANKVVFNITVADREATSTNHDISYGKVIQICNENTEDLTAIDILEDFRLEDLREPNFEVYPQMRKVDVKNYYKGHYGKISFQSYNQLTKEVGFFDQDNSETKMIAIDDVVASTWQREEASSSKPLGITAIVASAGSGKSTLTRRIARQALGISAKQEVKDSPSCNQKMVHYIELKDVADMSDIKPSYFLFGGLYQTEEEIDRAFEWLDKHQSEAVVIFDGLDQARWDFDQESIRKIRKHEKANSWTVMYNILSRNILRQVKIYIASREFKVSELPALARPETIVTLNGLTLEDAHRLFVFLLKEEGQVLWQKIETMSPRLLNLVSVPVFLILTAVVMGRDPSRPPPTTVTELYNRIISALQSVENIRNREQILSIVNKLKALAFQGMNEGRVVFKETDLKLFGVSAEEVQDLMTKVPGNNLLSRHLMQGDFTFFFCHQSLQEYLAAVFVTEMEFNEFTRFGVEQLYRERWSVVRRFVAGILFSKSQNDLYTVSHQTKKQQVFVRSIRSQLKRKTEYNESAIRIELYTAIYESDNENLMKNLSVIDVSRISLSRDQAHIVGSLAARNQSLDSLKLYNCSIDEEVLGIIVRCLKNRIYAKEVDLRGNKLSATALRSFIGHRRIVSLSGNLDWGVAMLNNARKWEGVLENEKDGIKIGPLLNQGKFQGHFNIKDSSLSFEMVHFREVATVEFAKKLFDARFVKLIELFVKQDDLRKMPEYKVEKICKILLDCTQEEDIDWSLIETSLKSYQVDILDIAVSGQILVDDYNRILERGSVFGNIQAMFTVENEYDFEKIVEFCHQKKIEYIRCIFTRGCYISLEKVSSLVNNSNLKKITWIYWESDMWRRYALKKPQIANDLDTDFELLCYFRETDVWKELDKAFYDREWERKRQIYSQHIRDFARRMNPLHSTIQPDDLGCD